MKYLLLISLAVGLSLQITHAADAPKKLLIVTTTTGFRHTSIPTLEKVLAQLGKDSGAFTADYIHQPPGEPKLKRDATNEDKAAFKEAHAKWEESVKSALQKLSPDNLKNYDGVVFASTTGDLPIPDPQGFLDWIKAGHAFIGIHSASDTFHNWPGFLDMIGGEFDHHGAQLGVEILNRDPAFPGNLALGQTWVISQEEMYQFKNYDPAKVHELLVLDKKPEKPFPAGHFPVSWYKFYGQGRVFYTSLGHREDIIDADPNLPDRKNPPETSKLFQAHVLGGIQWSLGLKK